MGVSLPVWGLRKLILPLVLLYSSPVVRTYCQTVMLPPLIGALPFSEVVSLSRMEPKSGSWSTLIAAGGVYQFVIACCNTFCLHYMARIDSFVLLFSKMGKCQSDLYDLGTFL